MQQAPLGVQMNNIQIQMNYPIRSNTTGVEYTIISQIGVGAEGIVYKGQASNSKSVAIKMLFSQTKKDGLDSLQKKKYKHLINILEIIVQLDNTFIIMEYADGEFYKYMQTQEYQNKTNDEKNQLFQQIVKGVEEIHQLNYIHRDIKPENVLYFKQENGDILLKLCDFGLLKNSADFRKTPNIGTPYYWAPEIITDNQTTFYTNQVDIWALGMLWYEMLTGKPLLYSFQTVESLQKHIKGINQQWLDNEIDKCQQLDVKVKDLLKNKILLIKTFPTQRATASQLVQDLQDLLGQNGSTVNQIQVQQLQGQQCNRVNELPLNQLKFGQQVQFNQGEIPIFKPQQNYQQLQKAPAQQFTPNFIPQKNLQQQNQSSEPISNPQFAFQAQGMSQNNWLIQQQSKNLQQNAQENYQFQNQIIQILKETIKTIQDQTEDLKQQKQKLEVQSQLYQEKIETLQQQIIDLENNHKKQFEEQVKKQIEAEAQLRQNNSQIQVLKKQLQLQEQQYLKSLNHQKTNNEKSENLQTQTLEVIFNINHKILQYQSDYFQDEIKSFEQNSQAYTYDHQSVNQLYKSFQEKINQNLLQQQQKQSELNSKLFEKSKETLDLVQKFIEDFISQNFSKKTNGKILQKNVEIQCENNLDETQNKFSQSKNISFFTSPENMHFIEQMKSKKHQQQSQRVQRQITLSNCKNQRVRRMLNNAQNKEFQEKKDLQQEQIRTQYSFLQTLQRKKSQQHCFKKQVKNQNQLSNRQYSLREDSPSADQN